jgi:endonuclease/exonuclease/phosphatase family metal-dependent hydrolase
MLYAEIQGVQIVCTHLSSRLSTTYSGDHESYQGENLYQMDTIRAVLDGKDPNKPQIIMGDFNAGPALGDDIAGELEDNYQTLEADGYVCANTASETPFCTWCADNLLINDPTNNAIDHVMVRYAETSNPRRLLDTPITVETEDAPGGSAEVNLSDHFGLQATVSWPKD